MEEIQVDPSSEESVRAAIVQLMDKAGADNNMIAIELNIKPKTVARYRQKGVMLGRLTFLVNLSKLLGEKPVLTISQSQVAGYRGRWIRRFGDEPSSR